MARRKQRETFSKSPASAQAAQEDQVYSEEEVARQLTRRITLKEYLLLNALFDGFCLVQLLLVRVVLHESRGLYYFFGLLMVGFLVVSAFDYAYDRLLSRSDELPES